MAAKNAQTNNNKPTSNNQAVAKQQAPVAYKNPGTEAVDRAFDAAREYCEKDPKTAKRIGGTVMASLGVGFTIGGAIMIGSTF